MEKQGALTSPLPALNDPEGTSVPKRFNRVIDAHVHLFPPKLFKAVWTWFDQFGWPVRYRMDSQKLVKFLLARGVDHVVGLQYAHKPGIAGDLNAYMADLVKQFKGRLTGMATVFPGEKGAAQILKQGFDLGLGGVKLHVHVQCFELTGNRIEEIYECCSRYEKPLVIHAGREPKSPSYSCDPHELCEYRIIEKVIRQFPGLKVCVPHLGMDELDQYADLIESHDNLWLDTSMALTDYLPIEGRKDLSDYRSDRVMYGSDFPNIPFAWDRELRLIEALSLAPGRLEQLLWKNAVEFFNIGKVG